MHICFAKRIPGNQTQDSLPLHYPAALNLAQEENALNLSSFHVLVFLALTGAGLPRADDIGGVGGLRIGVPF